MTTPMRRVEALRRQLSAQPCAADGAANPFGDDGRTPIACGGTHALPFEAWRVGERFVTKRRTVSETDVVQFTQLTGYANENLFGDMVYLRQVGHERRLAPGLLTTSIADALIVGSGILEGYAVALLGITDMRSTAAVYAGDSLQVHLRVESVTPSKSKPDRGVVTTLQKVVNQDGRVVLEYTVARMLRRSA